MDGTPEIRVKVDRRFKVSRVRDEDRTEREICEIVEEKGDKGHSRIVKRKVPLTDDDRQYDIFMRNGSSLRLTEDELRVSQFVRSPRAVNIDTGELYETELTDEWGPTFDDGETDIAVESVPVKRKR
jgi:hypothetical protein